MKLIAKPIEMIAWFAQDGTIHPIRFRILNDQETLQVIKVDKIISIHKEKKAGNPVNIYKCQSAINGVHKIFELKYELNTCSWILFKI